MNLIDNLLPENLTSALGWTIIHSLWQGAVIALLLSLLLLFLQKNSAKIRSAVANASLIIFLGAALITFLIIFNSETQPVQNSSFNFENSEKSASLLQTFNITPEEESSSNTSSITLFAKSFEEYFNRHLPLIVTLWLLGIMIFSLKLMGGLAYTRRLRYHLISEPEQNWSKYLEKLSYKLKITKQVKLLESALIKIPMTLGYLKPVILLPLGTITGLPQNQIEAIIIHELAHIRRADYLLNIFQSIVETLFFYHPAIWWISSLIKTERENSCDDITLQVTGDPLTFIKALSNIQIINSGEPGLALAVAVNKKQLLRRVKRMLNKSHKQINITARIISILLLSVILTGAVLFSGFKTENKNIQTTLTAGFSSVDPSITFLPLIKPNLLENTVIPPDSTYHKKNKKSFSFYDEEDGEENHWEVVFKGDEISELYKNGNRIPPEEIEKYKKMVYRNVDELKSGMRSLKLNMKDFKIDMGNFEESMKELQEKLQSKNWNLLNDSLHNLINNKEWQHNLQKLQEKIQKLQKEKLDLYFDSDEFQNQMKELKERLREFKFQHDYDFDSDFKFDHDFDFDFDFDMRDFNEKMKEFNEQMKNFKIDIDIDMSNFNKQMEKLSEELADLDINMDDLNKELKKLDAFMDELREELVKDGYINNTDEEFELDLSRNHMTVNGERLPEDLFEKYKRLYETHFGKEIDGDSHFKIHQ